MYEELRKNLSSWLKLLDNRRRRRGGPPVPRRTTVVQAQKFLTPRERQRLIVKNYFHKVSFPESTIATYNFFSKWKNLKKGIFEKISFKIILALSSKYDKLVATRNSCPKS